MSHDQTYDVIVIGAGPAGSTAATVLAMHGRRVLVLEKEKFPRYSIGESLLPCCYFPLERIGVLDQMTDSRFQVKRSVQFVNSDGSLSQPFYFDRHLDHPAATTWQVLRSEFDQMLLDNSRSKGVEVREETRVLDFLGENGAVVGVRALSSAGEPVEFRASMTVDASGRDALGMSRNRWREPDSTLKKFALWTYYRGAQRDSGRDEGATTVAFLPDSSWFWYIPLPDGLVSVGIVANRDYLFGDTRDLETIFDREVAKNRWIREHLAPGERVSVPIDRESPFHVTSEWSYRSRECADTGLLLTGDALGFLDPVFSSGVFLALKGGEMAGDAVHAALEAGDLSPARFEEYGAQVRHGFAAMRALVYAFYDQAFSMREFLTEYPHLKGDVTDCLIGNLFRDYDELFSAVERFAGRKEGA